MKSIYRLFKHGNYFYCEDSRTGKQKSLRTGDRTEAERLIAAKNEAVNTSELSLAVGHVYLAAIDPEMLTRTWASAMQFIAKRGGESTQERTTRAVNCKAFDAIRHKPIIETTANDFLAVMTDNKKSTNHYLKLLQSVAINLGWLVGRTILPKQCWPRIKTKEKRAITAEEHSRILSAERNHERKLFYEVLWETGASQSDAAAFTGANLDWQNRTLIYHRGKTGRQAIITIGSRFEEILRQLPSEGALFPRISGLSCIDRAAEFSRRVGILEIKGISLHSYRYAWAERAFSLGYPERFAQAALGHESKAIHYAYARRAKVNCPSLENYEPKPTPPSLTILERPEIKAA